MPLCRVTVQGLNLQHGTDLHRRSRRQTAAAGEQTTLTLRGSTLHDNSIYYAAPEVLKAATDSSSGHLAFEVTLAADPAFDVWAVAAMAFDALQDKPAIDHEQKAQACAIGADKYPWEVLCVDSSQAQDQPRGWQGAERLRPILEPCLARDATERPDAKTLHAQLAELDSQQRINGASSSE